MILQQRLAEAVNTPQGRAQVVRHRVAERFQFAVLTLKLVHESSPVFRKFTGKSRRAGAGQNVQSLDLTERNRPMRL